MKKVARTLDQLLECPNDQRIAVEGGLQRAASVIVMQELFHGVSRRMALLRNVYRGD